MILSDVLEIKKGSIVSIVGAGGKTTMMFKLAKELSKDAKVLVTTTTKIFRPEEEQYDKLVIDPDEFDTYNESRENGIYVYGRGISPENKLLSLESEDLKKAVGNFDYIIIEADGSKGLPLKGWNDTEPVVYEQTDKTVAIIDITALGLHATDKNVHRCDLFCEIAKARRGDRIRIDHLVRMITHPRGLFKNSVGEKHIFINKAETPIMKMHAEMLHHGLELSHSDMEIKVHIGSLLK